MIGYSMKSIFPTNNSNSSLASHILWEWNRALQLHWGMQLALLIFNEFYLEYL